ncbi:asparagine synthase (glutamine-hydrolyzing) [Humisphaera borealis]|uniref:asparagine synthase (glutamine-hydrolyzing) n=1 Tax=Humisphaera borealis TaxID=2807512 RepID=A0A7M2WV74_9BACT|nr:asparagine synthase (glutamine-hydrolyzing) [Humisphaera borealis]QOV89438.1 asparagine synthase (glutamine-hydrolyzing) [Humisphaera borealis]
MCGIAAILADSETSLDPQAIARMTAALVHRGPDDQRTLRLPGCDLGHTRLSILDLAGGAQPMAHPSGRWTIVFNGEIYNHAELRQQLEGRGVAFRTRSDTEVLLHAYVEFGPACLNRLNGQFAFAVWDRDRRELFAARDRFGEKPLYWARSPQGHVLLGSEIKAIEASGLVSPRIDLMSVEMYLGLYYVPPDRTIYRNVHTLPPGHAIIWRHGESCVCDDVRAYRWWTPRLSHLKLDRQDAVGEIRRLLGAAVSRQMVADVPVGAFLSGGLDSSTIVALMSDSSKTQASVRIPEEPDSGRLRSAVRTFAAGFGELIDELPFAREVAERYRTDHHESQIERIDVAAELTTMATVYDEPFGDSSNIPTSLISRQARQGVKVVLSGDGGDELFGGYAWYEPAIARCAASTQRSTGSSIGEPGRADSSYVLNRGECRTAQLIAAPPRRPLTDPWAEHVARTGPIGDDRRGLWAHRGQPAVLETLRQCYDPRHGQGLDVATRFDVGCYLAGDILVKVDRAAMSCGLETRAPFLDADLTEFVLGLPWQMRFGTDGGTSPSGDAPPLKGLLREACADLWPASIRKRNKQGFGAPVRHWLQRPEVDEVWRRVTRPGGALAALLPGVADADITNALRPQRKWSVLCLGTWLEQREGCLADLR